MITGIRTKNFRKLGTFSTDFKDGTNLLFGENGEGKSTLFEAIRFALFGMSAVSGTADTLLTWGMPEGSSVSVELDMHGYTFRRTLSGCRVKDSEGEIVADGNTPSTRFAEKLLGCTLKDFDLLYMSKQGETAGLITFGATGLNRKVEEYAGVAVIDKVIKSLGSDIHGIQVALESFNFEPVEEMEKQLYQIESDGTDIANTESALTQDKEDLLKLLTGVQRELGSANQFNNEQDEIAKAQADLRESVIRAEAKVSATKETLDKVSADHAEVSPVLESDIEAEREKIREVRQVSRELNDLRDEAELEEFIKQAEEKTQAQAVYENALPGFEEAESNARAALERARETHNDNLRGYKAATKAEKEGVCGECGKPLDDHDPEAAKAKVTAAATKVSESSAVVEVAESNFNAAKQALRDHARTNPGTGHAETAEKFKVQLDNTRKCRQELEAKQATLELEDTISARLNSLVSDQAAYDYLSKKLNFAEEDHGKAEKRLADLKDSCVAIPQEKIDTTPLLTKLNELTAEVNETSNKLTQVSSEHSRLTAEYKALRDRITLAKANNAKMSEFEASLEKSKQLRNYLNEERVKFMEGVWRTILGTASHFINKSTDGWISAIGRNDKGDFTYTENGNEAVAKDSASGAQKAFIGTALKIGLAQAKMGSNSMVMLDEPTADMRNDNASKLASGLSMLSGQKLMITHRDSERMIAQHIIQVGEFNN